MLRPTVAKSSHYSHSCSATFYIIQPREFLASQLRHTHCTDPDTNNMANIKDWKSLSKVDPEWTEVDTFSSAPETSSY